MTSFTGPLKIKSGVGNTDHTTTIDTAGTAKFSGTLSMTAAGSAAGATSFVLGTDGVLKSGVAAARGEVVLTQKATVAVGASASTLKVTVPNGSDIIEIYCLTTDGWGIGADQADIKIGVSGDDTYFATIPVSGTGFARATPTSAVRWLAVSGNTAAIKMFVTAASTAPTSGQSVVNVVYAAR